MKICLKCKRDLPLNSFYVRGNKKGLRPYCKECHLRERRERYKDDPKCRENSRLQSTRWAKDHKDRIKEIVSKSFLKYREKYLAIKRKWREDHPEESRANGRRWYNRDRQTKYVREKRRSDPTLRLISNQRTRVYFALKRKDINKKSSTLSLVGCSIFQLKNHLAGKFREGMTWENHGKFGWHVDHIKPLASFDFSDPKQIEVAFHFSNLQPLWWYENLRKSNKIAV
jgi:hypothetical protein